jgi:hypothetical protein
MRSVFSLLLSLIIFTQSNWAYPKMNVWVSTYYADHWSDTGRYRQVSKNGKRLGNFVALNFLPGGSIIMIPKLFKTTKFEVADTFGSTGIKTVKGKKYWLVDILRNHNEWYDDHDFPVELLVVKYNKKGPVKNRTVRKNCTLTYNKLYPAAKK